MIDNGYWNRGSRKGQGSA